MSQQWPSGPFPRPSRWPTVAIIVAGVVTVVALSVSGFLGWKLAAQRQTQQDSTQWRSQFTRDREAHAAGEQAQEAAKAFVLLMVNVDYRDFDRNVAAVTEKSTGEFKEKYTASSAQLRQTMTENKASATGVVVDSAIQSEAADTVTMLFFIDQSVTNLAIPEPRMDRSRAVITMEKVGDRWLASKVEIR